MKDIYLRFPTRDDALTVLRGLGMTYTDDEGEEHASQGSHAFAMWEVGEIAGVEGWHINLRVIDESLDLSALDPYSVTPAAPRCVWA